MAIPEIDFDIFETFNGNFESPIHCLYCGTVPDIPVNICQFCCINVLTISVWENRVYTRVSREKNTYFGSLNLGLPKEVFTYGGESIEETFKNYDMDDMKLMG